MSNFKTDRDHLIQELIPELIKHLTRLPPTDSRYRRCLEYATSKINNQNELAVNGHDVQRRIEGMCEKFAVSNYQLYSDSLRQWKEEIASHPFITHSDQVDIHWVVMELLLSTAFNPVDSITNRVIKNDGKLIEFPVAEPDGQRKASEEATVPVLPDLNRNSQQEGDKSDDELSDWSDDSDPSSADAESAKAKPVKQYVHHIPVVDRYPGLKPPQKEPHYVEVKNVNSEKWFKEFAQNSFWYSNDSQTKANSTFTSAEFAQKWNEYVDNLSLGFVSDKGLSTTSEFILLREIIWMLLNPVEKCKYFRIEDNSVKLNDKVTTTSCSLPIIQSFLSTITTPMSNLLQLKQFIKSIQGGHDNNPSPAPPVIYETFAGCLMEHIAAMEEYVLEVERNLIENNDFTTSLKFLESLQSNHFKTINALFNVYQFVSFNWASHPNFISSTRLLAKLWEFLECPLEPMENNLAISILIPCIRPFLATSDSWWSLGRLHDYTDEFLVTEAGADREIRSHEDGKFILRCPLIKYLLEYCKESNVILNHLFSMDRVNILDELNCSSPSYNALLEDFLAPFQIPPMVTEETQTESPLPVSEYYCDLMELLLLKDQQASNRSKIEEDWKISSPLEIYKTFQVRQANFSLPYQEMVLRSLRKVLKPRLDAAHKRVARVFLEEFKIAKHFRNVHWVLLLESPAMFDFYTDLFVAIEEDFNNLSSYQLTAKLETCLHALHPKMDSLFTVDFDRHYYKTDIDTILDCLEKLRIEYTFHDAEAVIDFNRTTIYNRAFSFLLQIKWALWLLENLQFGVNFARVKVFKSVNVLDFSIRRMSILRFWLLVAIKSVHSYLMNQVVENETRRFEKALESKCASLAKIKDCHEQFLKVIETKCFLTERQGNLLAVFQEFLNFILVFRDYWHQLRDVSDRDYQLEHVESKKILLDIKIEKLEETYSNIHSCVIEKLQQEVEISNDDHLKGLLGAFVYKQPTSYAKKS